MLPLLVLAGMVVALSKHRKVTRLVLSVIMVVSLGSWSIDHVVAGVTVLLTAFILVDGFFIMKYKQRKNRFAFVECESSAVIYNEQHSYNFNPLFFTLLPQDRGGAVVLVRPRVRDYQIMSSFGRLPYDDFAIPKITIGSRSYIVMERNTGNEPSDKTRSYYAYTEQDMLGNIIQSDPQVHIQLVRIGYNPDMVDSDFLRTCCTQCKITVPQNTMHSVFVGTASCALTFLERCAKSNPPATRENVLHLMKNQSLY